jgi:hypothetical protein
MEPEIMSNLIGFPWKHWVEEAPGEAQLLQSALKQTKKALQQAYASFDVMTDPDLIDSCIFEIKAASARYNYLLRKMKTVETQEDAP